jgi:hypothetical protein
VTQANSDCAGDAVKGRSRAFETVAPGTSIIGREDGQRQRCAAIQSTQSPHRNAVDLWQRRRLRGTQRLEVFIFHRIDWKGRIALRSRTRLRFGGVQPNPVGTGFKYIRKIFSGCLPKLLSNLLLTHLRTSLAITCTKAPGLGESAHNLRGVQKLVNQRQVHRSRKSLSVVLDEIVVLIGNYDKIAIGPRWFTKRAVLLFRVGVKFSTIEVWLIP